MALLRKIGHALGGLTKVQNAVLYSTRNTHQSCKRPFCEDKPERKQQLLLDYNNNTAAQKKW